VTPDVLQNVQGVKGQRSRSQRKVTTAKILPMIVNIPKTGPHTHFGNLIKSYNYFQNFILVKIPR